MTVWVVLEHQGQMTRLVGAYVSPDVAGEVTASAGWSPEVVPCDVLDQAP